MNKKIAKGIVCVVFAGVFSLLSTFQNGWLNSKSINVFSGESVAEIDGIETVTLTADSGSSNAKAESVVGVEDVAGDIIDRATGASKGNAKLANNTEGAETDQNSLSVTFFNFGDGDCTLIKYQNTEILVDVGDVGWTGKMDSVKNSLRKNISDGVLDYFIVTHGDQDHIANAETVFSWFDRTDGKNCLQTDDNRYYTINKIIDFDSPCKEGAYKTVAYEKYKDPRGKYCDNRCLPRP